MKPFLLAIPFIVLNTTLSVAQVAAIDFSDAVVLTDDGDGDPPDPGNRGPLMCFSDANPAGIPCQTRAECISAGLPEDECALGFP